MNGKILLLFLFGLVLVAGCIQHDGPSTHSSDSQIVDDAINTAPTDDGSAKSLDDYANEKDLTDEDLLSLEEQLDEFSNNIVSGGPGIDGIPPIDSPTYVSVEEADELLENQDPIFLIEADEGVKMFPQRILVWHEIVNEEIDGEAVSVTYCPLTGSAIGYKGNFGTSGKLLNSNLVMYDRATSSYWPQVLGVAVNGDQKGAVLETHPVIWTTWELAKAKYPNAEVLSSKTGFLRDYNNDPYGSYFEGGSYYDSGGTFFPVMAEDSVTFSNKKEIVIGLKNGLDSLAIHKDKLREEKVANLQVDSLMVVAIYDESLDTIRTFDRSFNGEVLEFEIVGSKIMDSNGVEWGVDGSSMEGELKLVSNFDVMWFAWKAFYPDTQVYK